MSRFMDANDEYTVVADEARIRGVHLLVFPLAWIGGILSLQFLGRLLPDSLAFISSTCGALLGVTILWFFFLKRLGQSLSFFLVLLVFLLKVAFVYYIWTTEVFAPLGGGDLEMTQIYSFGEAYHFWTQVQNIIAWWETNGFTIFFPHLYVNYEHPQAMALIALPFTALPLYSEVLIPWNMFYTTAAGAAIYAIGRSEGFSQRVCALAFYLVLIQPFGWYVWEPLKRDTQCQMCFAFFLLAVILFLRRKRIVAFVTVSILGCFVLNLYRTVYGVILVCTSIYAYVREGGRIGRNIAGRILIIAIMLIALFVFVPQYSNRAADYVTDNLSKYGVGDTETVSEKGYQTRLTRYNSWILSIPERLALGLALPFPWTDIFNSRNVFQIFSRITDYLHTALMFVCFATIAVFGWRDLMKRRSPPVSVIFALGIAATGFFGCAIHNVYVHVGMLSTFPYVMDKLGKGGMCKWFLKSVGLFIFSSIIWEYIR